MVEAAPKPSDTDAGVAALNFFGGEAPPEAQSGDHDGVAEAPRTGPELAQHDADAFDMGKGPQLDINGLVSSEAPAKEAEPPAVAVAPKANLFKETARAGLDMVKGWRETDADAAAQPSRAGTPGSRPGSRQSKGA